MLRHTAIIIFLLGSFCSFTLGQPALIDPGFKDQTRIVYTIDLNGQEAFEYVIKVKSTEEKYEVLSWSKTGTAEAQKEQTIYARKPFRPLYYNISVDEPKLKYSKSIWWDWDQKICDFHEVAKELGKKDQGEKFSAKLDEERSLYNFALINTGLLCGLPLSDKQDQYALRIYFGQKSANVKFKVVGEEILQAGDHKWECYKVEANPELGPFLNVLKFFMGNPKSYIWLTNDFPRYIIKAHIKMPWMEYNADLKEIKNVL